MAWRSRKSVSPRTCPRFKSSSIPGPFRIPSDSELSSAVSSFISTTRYRLDTPESAFNKCNSVSEEFSQFLKLQGFQATVIQLVGCKPDLDPNHAKKWCVPKNKMHHYAVLSGNNVVDMTAIQFGQSFYRPSHTFTLPETKDRWIEIYNTETGEQLQ